MEKILSIEEVKNHPILQKGYNNSYTINYDGYLIKTDAQEISILISNEQSCCESWGYAVSEDDLGSFIGSDLLDVKLINKGLNEKMLRHGESLDEGSIMFVNLETSKGTLQFAVYNGHNGYYGHDAIVNSIQVRKEVGL